MIDMTNKWAHINRVGVGYVQPDSGITVQQRQIVEFFMERNSIWRELFTSGPKWKAEWYNWLVDWLITKYPHEFYLSKCNRDG